LREVLQLEGLDPDLPIFALGASNGGAFVLLLARWVQLSAAVCLISSLQDDVLLSIPRLPPTFFVHMERDVRTAAGVKSNLRLLREQGIAAEALVCGPKQITSSFFTEHCDMSAPISAGMAKALGIAGMLDEAGFLKDDPRTSNWRCTLRPLVPVTEDSLEADRSPIAEALNVAWGLHEMTAEGCEEALSFCFRMLPAKKELTRETVHVGARLPLTVGVGTCQVHTQCQVPPDMMETFKQIGAPAHFMISVGEQLDWALRAGCRLIDTAQRYGNEDGVGAAVVQAIEAGVVSRGEVFVVTKIEPKNFGFAKTVQSFDESLRKMGLESVDLLLLHFPPPKELRQETWMAMEQLYNEGKASSIGVANHSCTHLEELLAFATVPPAVNQIEVHPYHAQFGLVEWCQGQNMSVMGYSPLGGKGAAGQDTGVTDALLADRTITMIARSVGRTPVQVILRWTLQRGVTPIPKAASPERLAENMAALDFELSEADMDALNGLDRGQWVVCDVAQLP